MKLFSWNVNGVRAVLKKGALQHFLADYQPDVLCLQEIKARPEQVDYAFDGYQAFWNSAERPGYSGTATLVRVGDFAAVGDFSDGRPRAWSFSQHFTQSSPRSSCIGPAGPCNFTRLGRGNVDKNDSGSGGEVSEKSPAVANLLTSAAEVAKAEGRVLVTEFERFHLVNVYVPNSKPDLARLELREREWDPWLLQLLKELEECKPVVVCGDFNAAHEERDLARPQQNHHHAGFTDEERKGVSNLLAAGFVDTFRALHPEEQRYTWWSHWGRARENNVGWRIDYFFISQNLGTRLKNAEIYESVLGSDHCPVSIELEV